MVEIIHASIDSSKEKIVKVCNLSIDKNVYTRIDEEQDGSSHTIVYDRNKKVIFDSWTITNNTDEGKRVFSMTNRWDINYEPLAAL